MTSHQAILGADDTYLDTRLDTLAITDATSAVTQYTYDAVGNQTKVTAADGTGTTYGYDALGRTIAVTDTLGDVSKTGYDAFGNVVTSTDALGRVTTYQYNADGELITTTYPTGYTKVNTYDKLGDTTAFKDKAGVTTNYLYSTTLGVELAVTYTDGSTVAYAYDADGQRLSMTDGTGTTYYTYDADGRLATQSSPYARLANDATVFYAPLVTMQLSGAHHGHRAERGCDHGNRDRHALRGQRRGERQHGHVHCRRARHAERGPGLAGPEIVPFTGTAIISTSGTSAVTIRNDALQGGATDDQAYQGQTDTAGTIDLPVVDEGDTSEGGANLTSYIAVQNSGATAVTATVQYYDQSGTSRTSQAVSVPADGQAVLTPNLGAAWQGSAIVTASSGQSSVAVVSTQATQGGFDAYTGIAPSTNAWLPEATSAYTRTAGGPAWSAHLYLAEPHGHHRDGQPHVLCGQRRPGGRAAQTIGPDGVAALDVTVPITQAWGGGVVVNVPTRGGLVAGVERQEASSKRGD